MEDMNSNVGSVLSVQVVATQVVLNVKLHSGLEFRNEDVKYLNEDKTLMTKNIGNVTREAELTFEYRLKRVKELLQI
jgi:hypothetical protein